jgi:hypothetical protein
LKKFINSKQFINFELLVLITFKVLVFIYKMTKNVKYNIIRVPRKNPYVDVPVSFPPLGRLYLELMENKEKVIPNLVNVEHIPKSPGPQEQHIPTVNPINLNDKPDDGNGTDRDKPSREPTGGEEWGDKYKKIRDVLSEFKDRNRGEINSEYKEKYEHKESNYEDRHREVREDRHREDREDRHREDRHREERHKDDREDRHREDRHREDREDRHREDRHREDREDRHREDRHREDRHREDREDRHREDRHKDDREDRHKDDREDRHKDDREDRHKDDREDREDRHKDDRHKDDREDRDDREDIHREDREKYHKRSKDYKDYDSESDLDEERRRDYSDSSSSDSEDDLSNRLKKLLADSDSEDDFKKRKYREERQNDFKKRKYREDRENDYRVEKSHQERQEPFEKENPEFDRRKSYKEDKYSRARGNPPTLAELEASGHHKIKKDLPDITHGENSVREEEEFKREMLFKFELLRKSYKGAEIPTFTIHSDLPTMERTYESTLKSLSLDASVTDYKKYLLMAFMGIEFTLGTFLKFDMEGFTQQQILSMNSYERLLLEMGEKSYVPGGSKFPVEVRLLFLVLMNTAFFLFGKMVSRKTGFNPTGMLSRVSSSSTASAHQRRRRPMRGPGIDPDDIPGNENTPDATT